MNDTSSPSPASRRAALAAFAIALAALLSACGTPNPPPNPTPGETPDAGVAPTDAGVDAGEDGGADGGEDSGDGGFALIFQRQLGTATDDDLTGVLAAADGTVFAFGYEDGHANGANDGPTGAADAVVIQWALGSDSLERFRLSSGGTTTDIFEAALLEDGELLLAGRTRGAFAGATNAGKFDGFVTRMKADGTFEPGVFQFGDERPQHPRHLLRAGNGSLLVSGYNDLYLPANYVEANEDPTLVSLGGDGTSAAPWKVEHAVRFDSPTSDYALGAVAARDDSGDVFVARYATSGVFRGATVLRLSSSGAVVWERRLSTGPFDSATAVALAPSGELVVVGTAFLKFGETAYGQQDIYVVWLDPSSGDTLRAGQAGGSDSEWAHAVAIDARGHVYVAGYTLGEVATPYQGEADLLVLEFDAAGRWVSAWQHGTAAWDELQGIAVLPDGSVVVAGNTDGELVEGQRVGGRDALLLQLRPTTPVGAE